MRPFGIVSENLGTQHEADAFQNRALARAAGANDNVERWIEGDLNPIQEPTSPADGYDSPAR